MIDVHLKELLCKRSVHFPLNVISTKIWGKEEYRNEGQKLRWLICSTIMMVMASYSIYDLFLSFLHICLKTVYSWIYINLKTNWTVAIGLANYYIRKINIICSTEANCVLKWYINYFIYLNFRSPKCWSYTNWHFLHTFWQILFSII